MMQADLSPQAFEQARAFLSDLDPDWARLVARVGPCLHRAKPGREPFEALVRAVAYQQLHARAAEAILGRLLVLYPNQRFPAPEQLLATDPQLLRDCGLSARKLATILGIAQARLDGQVPTLQEARTMADAALVERLVSLHGVGRWTVEMLLIYSLERSDILPVDDFGIREGYRRLKGLERAPTPAQMRVLGEPWRPYRTVAAWYLWRA
ncbi:DNA-3-methyladenine glycosylase [Pseudomonas sp. K1(2024)]|uniref:DNA-3-methyladenine glycosylase II n=1 Tax=Pseudomonas boreofloridensis TaxID=3064348 RepID=A0ABV4Z8D9_9PSED|nr:DNA-3-methyladenine glycosylase [Pseudomonas sp. K13]MDO7903484.1 DNA-3-methyladenine glycosylase [Pseudomonas sp. K13]